MDAGAAQWLAAFNDLSTDRRVEYGMMSKPYVGPIPAASIDRAALEWPGEEAMFRQCIRAMDSEYLAAIKDDGPRVDYSRTFGPDVMAQAGRVSG